MFPFASAKHAACSEAPNGSGAKANGLGLIAADSGGVLGSVGSGGSAGSGGSVGSGGRCKAFIYVMHVAEELPAWPESKDRRRVWVSVGLEVVGLRLDGRHEPRLGLLPQPSTHDVCI